MMVVKGTQFYGDIAKQKTAYAEHVFRGSSGINVLLVSEGEINDVQCGTGWMISKNGQI